VIHCKTPRARELQPGREATQTFLEAHLQGIAQGLNRKPADMRRRNLLARILPSDTHFSGCFDGHLHHSPDRWSDEWIQNVIFY
jgi:hypothetical protein